MMHLEDHQTLMRDIAQACAEDARLAPACALTGIAARTLQRSKIDGLTRGARLKATTVLAMLHWLGIRPSYSRPRVSDDTPMLRRRSELRNIVPSSPSRGSPI